MADVMVRVRGMCVQEGGRYRGLIADGQSIYWTRDERELEIPESAYLECQGDPTIVIVRLDEASAAPAGGDGTITLTPAEQAEIAREMEAMARRLEAADEEIGRLRAEPAQSTTPPSAAGDAGSGASADKPKKKGLGHELRDPC